MTYIIIRPRAQDGLSAAPPANQIRIKAALDALQVGTFPPHTRKLGGVPDGYRTRIGRWRILFTLSEGLADIADIFLKKERGDYRRRR